jgi:hypothetical protein
MENISECLGRQHAAQPQNRSISDSNKSGFLLKSVQISSLPPTVKVEKQGTILPLSHMTSWHIEGHLFTDNLGTLLQTARGGSTARTMKKRRRMRRRGKKEKGENSDLYLESVTR